MDNQVYPAPVIDAAVADEEARGILKTGILAVVLSFLVIPGIILSVTGMRKSKAWAQKYGSYTAKVRVGRILAITALPSSIVWILCWLLWICILGFMIWIMLHTNDLPQPLSLEHLPEFIGMIC